MSVIIVFFLMFFWGILIIYIYRSMKGEHIYDWLEKYIGKLISKIILAVISFYFIFLASVTLKEMVIWTNISYLFKTPAFVLALFFIIPRSEERRVGKECCSWCGRDLFETTV